MNSTTESTLGLGDVEGAPDAPAEFVESFAASMPVRYRLLFEPRAARRHAAIAHDRRGTARVGVWRRHPDGTTALCVVADDRPGLLALIAATLASCGLVVVTALVFSRTTAGGAEAVDLFWVHREPPNQRGALGEADVDALERVLIALIGGVTRIDDVASLAPLPSLNHALDATVRFEEKDDNGSAVLTIEAPDAPKLLLLIAQTLYSQGAQIVRSLVRTVAGQGHNSFDLLEANGSSLTPERRRSIHAAVAAALAQRAIVDVHAGGNHRAR